MVALTDQYPVLAEPVHIPKRPELRHRAMMVAASLSMAWGTFGELVLDTAAADTPPAPATQVVPNATQPALTEITAPDTTCSPDDQVRLSLTSEPTTYGTIRYNVNATPCQEVAPSVLQGVTLLEQDSRGHHKSWHVGSMSSGTTVQRSFALPIPVKHGQVEAAANERDVKLEAITSNGTELGTTAWHVQTPAVPILEQCQPNPNFQIGIQDDNQFIFQQGMSRDEAFQQASAIFGANLLRINIVYGQVKQYGLQPYIDTVNDALAHGYSVDATLMPTPSYMQKLPHELNYRTMSPKRMYNFARMLGALFGNKISYYSFNDEPNHHFFNASLSTKKFDALYMAGRAGVLASDGQAKFLAGELAGGNIDHWEDDMNSLPNDGVAIHPYGKLIYQLPKYRAQAQSPLFLSEYGNHTADPNQMADDLMAIKLARCSGAMQLVLFQLLQDPSATWDTGVLDPSTHQRAQK